MKIRRVLMKVKMKQTIIIFLMLNMVNNKTKFMNISIYNPIIEVIIDYMYKIKLLFNYYLVKVLIK